MQASTHPSSAALPSSETRLIASAVRYLLVKVVLIGVTIFIGVFLTVLILNQPSRFGLAPARSPFETDLEREISNYLQPYLYGGNADYGQIEAMRAELRAEVGLDLPFLPRYLLWTCKALTFDWGRLTVANVQQLDFRRRTTAGARDIVLQYFPNTLLLMGSAYLLVFLIGIPLSLRLSRNPSGMLNRFLTALSPLSSVPSWVLGVLLISLFAVQLRWLPIAGMFEAHRPEALGERLLMLAQHMVLPVLSIVLSLLFQLVFAWRTFFTIHSGEDYVELAQAKGLPPKVLERNYILRPTLPYVITSFMLSLIGFWQMTMALEVVFQWPGLGWLYVTKALPNFWGESVYPGELIIAVGIVVIFAYLLGVIVFLLDLVYVIVDPRIHLLSTDRAAAARAQGRIAKVNGRRRSRSRATSGTGDFPAAIDPRTETQAFSWHEGIKEFLQSIKAWFGEVGTIFRELRRYPSAVFGACVIAVLGIGSVCAVIEYPYEQIGRQWNQQRVTGRIHVHRLAAPAWTALSTLIIDEPGQPSSTLSTNTLSGAWIEKTATFRFDYRYRDFPGEVYLYLNPAYVEKHPFVSVTWICPDGRRMDLTGVGVTGPTNFDFEKNINTQRLLNQYPEWKTWFHPDQGNPQPATSLLFAIPGSTRASPLQGTYQVEVKSMLFEGESDMETQLVLLGSVYGIAGTDAWRRDLIVPLLWGMPFTLVFGLVGAVAVTTLAMLIAAAGAWLSGWVDALIQGFTEVSMILPALAVGVLASALWGINLWVILALVVLLSVFGAPVKTFRSAFLQAKEAPYIEAARCYGATNSRIITQYLVPKIMPVLIPQIVILVPSFVFLEATLGIFNIRSNYPTWGTVIYDALSKGALYGSRFWVLEPICLLLLTGLAFALLGSGLERVLDLRQKGQLLSAQAVPARGQIETQSRSSRRRRTYPGRLAVGGVLLILLAAALVLIVKQIRRQASQVQGRLIASEVREAVVQLPTSGSGTEYVLTPTPIATTMAEIPRQPAYATASPEGTLLAPAPSLTTEADATATPSAVAGGRPLTYTLQRGEFPFCIARRFDVDPLELLAFNGLAGQTFFDVGAVLAIPQNGNPFPGDRMLRPHPAYYLVAASGITINAVACEFGDVDPLTIAYLNGLPPGVEVSLGQLVMVP
jgi:peptide/nickel transport system permease protein